MGRPPAALAALLALAGACGCAGSGSGSSGAAPASSAPPSRTSTSAPPSSQPASTTGPSARAPVGVALRRIATGLDAPLYVASPPGDRRLFVVEQTGRVLVFANGHRLPRPFLDVSGQISAGGERGLLSIAFDPRYRTTRRFAIDYTNRAGDTRVVLMRTQARHPNRADLRSARVLLAVAQPFANHNGGQLQFGPDGLLYISLGDGGSEGDPQNRGQSRGPLSTIMRIDIDAAKPHARMYAYGLRNPWRFSFDRSTGDMWIGDVGQNRLEEIDHLRAGTPPGTNFGWSYYEGRSVFKRQRIDRSRLVFPVAQYPHSLGCSVTGGYVYRGRALARLRGFYVYGDFCSGRIWRFPASGGKPRLMSSISGRVKDLSSFGEDARGELYVCSLDGSVYRLVAKRR